MTFRSNFYSRKIIIFHVFYSSYFRIVFVFFQNLFIFLVQPMTLKFTKLFSFLGPQSLKSLKSQFWHLKISPNITIGQIFRLLLIIFIAHNLLYTRLFFNLIFPLSFFFLKYLYFLLLLTILCAIISYS